MDLPTSLAETVKNLAVEYIGQQVETIRKGMGDKASDAVDLTPDEELGAWMRQTATPEKVAEMVAAGADDEEIFQESRRYRRALGKAAAKGDPRKEVEYHESMAAKAQALLARQQPMMGGGI